MLSANAIVGLTGDAVKCSIKEKLRQISFIDNV